MKRGFRRVIVTIILGAGASKAFTMCPYPLLSEMLQKMFQFSIELPEQISNKRMFESYLYKQRLLLTYSIMKALNEPSQRFEKEIIENEEIDYHFKRTYDRIVQNGYGLDKIFELLAQQEAVNYDSVTEAHWALTHAISVYMLQMFCMKQIGGHFDRAHIYLVSLINRLLKLGHSVNVVDFNYDCLLERIRIEYAGSSSATFGWDVGRKRFVIADDIHSGTVSDLVKAQKFREPWVKEDFPLQAKLIKPHGDMCTFLWGMSGIYYRGGLRHSQSTSAIFPKKLSDITEHDDYLRSSIMPPTKSRRRHSSKFYSEELQRFKIAINESSIFVIIGWSAKGTDKFYDEIFRKSFHLKNDRAKIFIIDKVDTRDRILELFGPEAEIKDLQTCGFNQNSALSLEKSIEAAM
ncbi:MAG: hypothetical protein A3J73_03645 [Planctomycetes bacterium RIFCSPHIGHO2_02_FULL_38_41]|nr:MAG: hypothetical protein A3J73_03645 [Planctomycetes bacterium RIFCSPHIGHO2_02_FULL_38_41]